MLFIRVSYVHLCFPLKIFLVCFFVMVALFLLTYHIFSGENRLFRHFWPASGRSKELEHHQWRHSCMWGWGHRTPRLRRVQCRCAAVVSPELYFPETWSFPPPSQSFFPNSQNPSVKETCNPGTAVLAVQCLMQSSGDTPSASWWCWRGGHRGLPASWPHEKQHAASFAGLCCCVCNSYVFYLPKGSLLWPWLYVGLFLSVLWQNPIITKTALQFGSFRRGGHCSKQFYRFIKFYTEHVLFCVSAPYLAWFFWVRQVFLNPALLSMFLVPL